MAERKMKQPGTGRDYFYLMRLMVAIGISFVIIAVIVLSVSGNPMNALNKLFLGPAATPRSFIDVLSYMIPLVFTGLAMNIALKSGLFNMGADGSFYMGAVVSSIMAVLWTLPGGLFQLVIVILAALLGGCINIIPALIRRYMGANEVVISLMFNFVFFFFGLFLMQRTVLDTTTGNQSLPFNEAAKIPKVFPQYTLHWGIVVMLAMVAVMYFIVERSNFGYQLRITGLNRNFARYSGVKVGVIVLVSQFIGGMLAGMGGSIQMLGMFNRFNWNLQVMYVWDGMLVNILAGGKPAYVPVAAFFLSYLRIGADVMARNSDVDSTLISIIQGVIILLVSSERFLYGMKRRRDERLALENITPDTQNGHSQEAPAETQEG